MRKLDRHDHEATRLFELVRRQVDDDEITDRIARALRNTRSAAFDECAEIADAAHDESQWPRNAVGANVIAERIRERKERDG